MVFTLGPSGTPSFALQAGLAYHWLFVIQTPPLRFGRCRKNLPLGDLRLFDSNVTSLFHSLRGPYPRAAAGLIDDVCVKLAYEAQERPFDSNTIESLTRILRDCFRPMDTEMPECYPWDQAYSSFGRFLWRDNVVLDNAVREITGWPESRLNECKLAYRDSVRIIRDEWQRAVDSLPEAD